MQAQDIMTRDVITVGPDMAVRDVAGLLLDKHISAAPVVDEAGKLIGIVSEGDLVRRPEIAGEPRVSWWLDLISSETERARDHVKMHGRTAGQVMTPGVAYVAEDTPVAEAARMLEQRRIKRVPVLRDGKVVGIVSRADLVRVLAVCHPPEAIAERQDDRQIRDQVQKVLEGQRWDFSLVNVVVEDGVVHLWALVEDVETRDAMKVAARNILGVKAVEAHFTRPPVWA